MKIIKLNFLVPVLCSHTFTTAKLGSVLCHYKTQYWAHNGHPGLKTATLGSPWSHWPEDSHTGINMVMTWPEDSHDRSSPWLSWPEDNYTGLTIVSLQDHWAHHGHPGLKTATQGSPWSHWPEYSHTGLTMVTLAWRQPYRVHHGHPGLKTAILGSPWLTLA